MEVLAGARFVDNGKIVTSAGLSAGLDASLHVVGKIRGEEAARELARHLEYDWRSEPGVEDARARGCTRAARPGGRDVVRGLVFRGFDQVPAHWLQAG